LWSHKHGEFRIDCLFCQPPDKQGHLYISDDEGLFLCHKCGAKGNFYQLQQAFGDRPGTHTHTKEKPIDSRILDNATDFYCSCIPSSIRKYLNDRLITNSAIRKYRLGYASGGLKEHLRKKGYTEEQMRESGLIEDDGSEYFKDNIIIPYLSNGRVILLRARTNPSSGSKKAYFPLPGTEVHLYNSDVLGSAHEETSICEGELDCIVLNENRFPAVGVPGTNSFKEEWKSGFDGIRNVYVCFDGDKSGREGTKRVAQFLGRKALIINLTEDQDVTDFFVNGGTCTDWEKLQQDAKPLIDIEIDAISSQPENQWLLRLPDLLPMLVDLSKHELSHYKSIIKKKLNINARTVDIALEEIRTDQAHERAEHSKQTENSFTEDELRRGATLLEDPDLIEIFLADVEKFGCVGEENNKLIIYLTLTSRKLDDPISLIMKGDSSSGKSFLVDTIMRFIPSDEILAFTTMTPKALYHRQDDLSHKALVIFEHHGSEDSDYSIRTLQSEKKLVISMPIKSPETNEWETKDHEIAGPVAYIETTTNVTIHPENETRCFSIYTDDSAEQTRMILNSQKEKYQPKENRCEVDIKKWQAAQTLLERMPVIIPFCEEIKFPDKPVRVRRDQLRFLTLIEVSALLHQKQREQRTINGTEYIVADIEDYAVAFGLGCSILEQMIKGVSAKAEELIHNVSSLVEGKNENEYVLRELVDQTGWNKKTVTKYHKECVAEGLVDFVEGGKGKAYKYRFVRVPNEHDTLLIHPNELKQILEHNRTKQTTPVQITDGAVKSLTDSDITEPVYESQENANMKMSNDAGNSVETKNDSLQSDG